MNGVFECSGWNFRQGVYEWNGTLYTFSAPANSGLTPWYGNVVVHVQSGASIVNNGWGAAASADGISNNYGGLNAGNVTSLHIINDGSIIASSLGGANFGIELSLSAASQLGPVTIENNGRIQGHQAAISLLSSGRFTLNNASSAVISARDIGMNLNSAGSQIDNYGVLEVLQPLAVGNYAIRANAGIDTLNLHSGKIVGNVFLLAGDDKFSWFGGLLQGNLDLGNGSDSATISAASFTPDFRLDGGDDRSSADGFVDTLTFAGITGTITGANLPNWENIVIDGAALTVNDGLLAVGQEAPLGLRIINGGSLRAGADFTLDGNVRLESRGLFGLSEAASGNISVTGNLDNAGVVALQNGVTGTNMTIAGNYIGRGGLLTLDTVLGADNSATDRLVISGATSGETSVRVNNLQGSGAPTSDGIRVIEVGGASNGTFTLQGDYSFAGQPAVIAGAYAYTLQHNGLSAPTDGHWYLRSNLRVAPPQPPEPPQPPQPPGPQPPDPPAPTPTPTPTPPPAPSPVWSPRYQPGAPLYETMPRVALGLMGLPTLQQRVGNRYWQDGTLAASGSDEQGSAAPSMTEGRGFWGRFDGQASRSASGISTTSARSEQHQWRAEVGIDIPLWSGPAGSLVGGVNAHYGRAIADISSPFGLGRNQTTGYGIGASATWYGAGGFYADAQGRLSWLDTDLTSHTIGRKMADGVKGLGHALSLELGQRVRLTPHLSLIPQAQLTWSGVSYDRFRDPYGASVSAEDGESLQARLGLALQHERQWTDAAGNLRRASLYGIANFYQEFLDGTSVNVSGTRLRNKEGHSWAGVGLGGSYNLNGDAFSLYGEIHAATNISGHGDSYRLGGKVGMRVRW